MEPAIFKPRLKFKPPLKFFKFGHLMTFLKSLRSVLERGPSARSFRSRSVFSIVPFCTLHDFKRSFQKFLFRSFKNRSNIFRNAFYAFVLFRNVGIVLDCSVRSCERTIVHQEQRPALVFSLLFIVVLNVVHYTSQILKFNFCR